METIKLEMQQRSAIATVRESKRTREKVIMDKGRNSDLLVSRAK
jgi:hypothetical protein